MDLLRGLLTLVLLGAFVWLVIWLFVVRKRQDFDAAARIPLDDKREGDSNE